MDDHQIESQISQGYRETKDRLAAPIELAFLANTGHHDRELATLS